VGLSEFLRFERLDRSDPSHGVVRHSTVRVPGRVEASGLASAWCVFGPTTRGELSLDAPPFSATERTTFCSNHRIQLIIAIRDAPTWRDPPRAIVLSAGVREEDICGRASGVVLAGPRPRRDRPPHFPPEPSTPKSSPRQTGLPRSRWTQVTGLVQASAHVFGPTWSSRPPVSNPSFVASC
jgi:hypothetical protein